MFVSCFQSFTRVGCSLDQVVFWSRFRGKAPVYSVSWLYQQFGDIFGHTPLRSLIASLPSRSRKGVWRSSKVRLGS